MRWTALSARAVKRGLMRRRQCGQQAPRVMSVDETSFKRGHAYVSVVTDTEGGAVLHVADGRDKSALDGYLGEIGAAGCARMWKG